MDEKEIANAIKSGGLYRIKAGRIKKIAEYIIKEYNGSMEWIYKMDAKEAKRL